MKLFIDLFNLSQIVILDLIFIFTIKNKHSNYLNYYFSQYYKYTLNVKNITQKRVKINTIKLLFLFCYFFVIHDPIIRNKVTI